MLDPNDIEEVRHLAHLMIDQLEWVDLVEPPPGDDRLCRMMTDHCRAKDSRDALRSIIDRICAQLLVNRLYRGSFEEHSVPAACELLTRACKGLLVACGNGKNDFLKRTRLAIKVESVPYPWMQDPPRESGLAMAARLGMQLPAGMA